MSNGTWLLIPVPAELDYKNLNVSSYFRAIVENGICPADTSPVAAVTVNPLPAVNFSADTAHLGGTTHFTNLTTIPLGKIITFDWDMGNGYSSSARNPVIIYSEAGVYKVKLNVTSDKGCLDSLSREVLVLPTPKAGFEVKNVCSGKIVSFRNTSSIASGSISYSWDFGDGFYAADTNPNHTYMAPGDYSVKLVAQSTGHISDSIVQTVTIYPNPVSDFTFSGVCDKREAVFTNNSGISSGSFAAFWKFGDGNSSISVNSAHTYQASGKYAVTLTCASDKGCVDSVSHTITIFPVPEVLFSSNDVPFGKQASFTDKSVVKQGSIIKWSWNFGDMNSSNEENPVHLYSSPGIYLISLQVTTDSGCVNSYSGNVQVFALPHASFSFSNTCLGDSMQFTNLSTTPSGNLSFEWNFGDLTNGGIQNPSHLYKYPGTYQVNLIAQLDNGGRDTVTHSVTVYPRPISDFGISGVCEGYLSTFQNRSTIETGTISSCSWDFGDGTNSVQTNPKKQYFNPGTYLVTLTAISDKGCSALSSGEANVYISPIANFSADHVCLGTKVKLSNMSSIETGTLHYLWDFKDGQTSIEANPEHLFSVADTFAIKLVGISDRNCKDSVVRSVIVRPAPSVDAGKDTTIILGSSVSLKATGGLIYDWSPISTLDNPVIATPIARPDENTLYKVRIVDAYNCENNDSVRITVIDEHRLIPTNVITPDGDGVNDTWHISNIDYYEQATVRIFNRWGTLVYEKSHYLQDWDGKNTRGDLLPDGTYYYVITFPNSSHYYSGAITILRNK